MRKSEKRTIIILLLILMIIVVGIWVWKNSKNKEKEENLNVIEQEGKVEEEYVKNLEDGSKVNISEELNQEKELDGLKITNIQLREIGGITTLLADVSNNTGKVSEERIVKVEVLDKEGKTITSLRGALDEIPDGGKVQLNIAVTEDVANAYDFRISEP